MMVVYSECQNTVSWRDHLSSHGEITTQHMDDAKQSSILLDHIGD